MKRALGAGLFCALSAGTALGSPTDGTCGVIVESLGPGWAGAAAGLRPGDHLLSWVSGPSSCNGQAGGSFASPFDVEQVELEVGSRGSVILAAEREGRAFSATLTPDAWRITARPCLDASSEAVLAEARRFKEGGRKTEAAEALSRAARDRMSSNPALAWWFARRAGEEFFAAGEKDKANATLRTAIASAAQAGNPGVVRVLFDSLAAGLERVPDTKAALEVLNEFLESPEAGHAPSMARATVLYRLGRVTWNLGDLDAADKFFRQSQEVAEAVAAESLAVTRSLNARANIEAWRVNLDLAESLYRRALAIQEKQSPSGLTIVALWSGLALVAENRGDWHTAEGYYERYREFCERAGDRSGMVAAYNNLSRQASLRGDLVRAETLARRAVSIQEQINPRGVEAGRLQQLLSEIALARHDLGEADRFGRESISTFEALSSEGLDFVNALQAGAHVAAEGGDFERAKALLEQALQVSERVAPTSRETGSTCLDLGRIAERRGDLAEADRRFRQALEIGEKDAPGSIRSAEVIRARADLTASTDPVRAEAQYRRVAAIQEPLVPGSLTMAETWHSLARVVRAQGRAAEAAGLSLRALTALEAQTGRLGGPYEVKAGFARKYAQFYDDAIDILVETGKQESAFDVLERSRARLFLAMLAERDLSFGSVVPPSLEDERRHLDFDFGRSQDELIRLSPEKNEKELSRLLDRLGELRARRASVAEQIRQASPKLALLREPEPLDLSGVRKSLDPGTVLLAYAIGPTKGFLFVVTPEGLEPGLAIYPIPLGSEALAAMVSRLNQAIQTGARLPPPKEANDLYALLVKPAEAIVSAQKRILVCADGPLHLLSFSSLRREGSYLVEWKPIHSVASATVYAEIRRGRRDASGGALGQSRLVAFGDPHYLAKGASDLPDPRSEETRGFSLDPLPATRKEVEAVVASFPGKATAYLGDDATEERAKALDKHVEYVHFACHGLLNERFPLNSALALSMPADPAAGRENGLLQAWEIFESVHLDAELVTMSACNTARGAEGGGEGLIGLTRAFQYAGARSVLASLWSVPDRSTAALMKRFYEELGRGETKDEALRAAQVAMIRSQGSGAAPLRWAAFQLIGDFR
jgi:CHAT domain-containing protein/tetratricopeptide (TPR) repeat protein